MPTGGGFYTSEQEANFRAANVLHRLLAVADTYPSAKHSERKSLMRLLLCRHERSCNPCRVRVPSLEIALSARRLARSERARETAHSRERRWAWQRSQINSNGHTESDHDDKHRRKNKQSSIFDIFDRHPRRLIALPD